MATYLIRGLPKGAIEAFKAKCQDALVNPDEVLRALILHTQPELVADLDETRIAHRIAFHHSSASHGVAALLTKQ